LVAHAVRFGLWSHVHKGQFKLIGRHGTPRDTGSSYASQQIGVGTPVKNETAHFALYKIADVGKAQQAAVVAVNGTLPTTGPGKRLLRLQLYGAGLQQFFGYSFFVR
jgi:hypothetical protein